MRGDLEFLAGLEGRDRLGLQGAIGALLGLKQKLRQRLHAGKADDEEQTEDEAGECEDVEDAAQALPAFALRVVEDRLGHRGR